MNKISKKIHKLLEQASSSVELLLSELTEELERIQEYYDNKSDNWKDGERGEEFQSWIESIEESLNSVQVAFDYLGEVQLPEKGE